MKNTTKADKATKQSKTQAAKLAGKEKPQAKEVKAKTPKAAKAAKPVDDSLRIHINPSGRVCFGKMAAARIGDLGFMKITPDGKSVRMIATATETETPIRRAGGRPYITATKELRDAKIFDGAALDLIAKPINSHGFELA
jgi:hypothetical protein